MTGLQDHALADCRSGHSLRANSNLPARHFPVGHEHLSFVLALVELGCRLLIAGAMCSNSQMRIPELTLHLRPPRTELTADLTPTAPCFTQGPCITCGQPAFCRATAQNRCSHGLACPRRQISTKPLSAGQPERCSTLKPLRRHP